MNCKSVDAGSTFTLNETEVVFPVASVAVKELTVDPNGNADPEGNPEVCVNVKAQLSVATAL
jgi:hypothetical protein